MICSPATAGSTQLLSQAVGPKGKVVAFANYSHDKFADRMKKAELKNVEEDGARVPEGVQRAAGRPRQAAGRRLRRHHHDP